MEFMASHSGMRIEVITDAAAFAALEEEWNALFDSNATHSIFLSHAWLYSWWEVYGNDGSLHIVVCRESTGNRLVGLFPACIRARRHFFRSLSFFGSDHVCSDFMDCIALPEHAEKVWGIFADYICQVHNEWDVVELKDVLNTSPLISMLEYRPEVNICTTGKKTLCPYMVLPESWQAYLGTLSKKMRWKVQYERRNLERHYTVKIRQTESVEELAQLWPDMVRLHQQRRTAKGDDGIFTSADFSRFLFAACERLLKAGSLRLSFLELNGENVAFILAMKTGTSTFYYQSGFNIDFSRYSVGSVLLGYVIENASNEGCTHFEFLRGDEKYKYEWASEKREMVEIFMYCKTLSGKTLQKADAGYASAKLFAKKMLGKVPSRV